MSESRGEEGVWTPSEIFSAYLLHSYMYSTIIKIGPRTPPPLSPGKHNYFLNIPWKINSGSAHIPIRKSELMITISFYLCSSTSFIFNISNV